MEHIKIEQNSNVEVVDSNIIHKLAEEAQDCDASSNMTGNLQTDKAYEDDVNFLTTKFPGLAINATQGLYVRIADQAVQNILATNFGDGVGITTSQILLITSLNGYNNASAFKNNTDIVSFDEFERFINCTQILNGVFQNDSNLERITLPSTLTIIGRDVFSGCTKLQSINLDNVEEIGNSGFVDCTSLAIDCATMKKLTRVEGFRSALIYGELDMPLLTTMGTYCFQGCGNITKVKCLGKLSAIPRSAFTKYPASSMALSEVYLPYECTEIGQEAFYDCANLTTIKQYNKSIDQYAEGESPVFTDIGARITSIGNGAFQGTGLSGNLSFPNLTNLGGVRVLGTNITSVDFTGSTFTTVDDSAFSMCFDLDHVIFPDTVTNVKKDAFYNCQNLSYIVLPTTSTITWEANRGYFTNVPSTCIIYVDDSKVSEVTAALSGKFNGQIKGISEMPTT